MFDFYIEEICINSFKVIINRLKRNNKEKYIKYMYIYYEIVVEFLYKGNELWG